MSFAEQERALFELIFDEGKQQTFVDNKATFLSEYALTEAEKKDFETIRIDALQMDARMRKGMVLSQLGRSYPVSFCLFSSLENGLPTLQSLIDVQTMSAEPAWRPVVFGKRLRDHWSHHGESLSGYDMRLHGFLMAILGAELSMMESAANIRNTVCYASFERQNSHAGISEESDLNKVVRFADYVSAVMLPRPYTELKNTLCPPGLSNLWRSLQGNPLTAEKRDEVLGNENPHLLVAKAYLIDSSRCAPVVEHKTVELVEGFAPLFAHVNGQNSVQNILDQFQQAGATTTLLKSIKAAFIQMLDNRMLEVIRD